MNDPREVSWLMHTLVHSLDTTEALNLLVSMLCSEITTRVIEGHELEVYDMTMEMGRNALIEGLKNEKVIENRKKLNELEEELDTLENVKELDWNEYLKGLDNKQD